ncbi:unnamed protein product [Blumeria hordei]|uniref:mRNA-capping enzyme subunit beta n=1 Tax=Blumeria hordei TaxID=2867405 RepID=A0A383UQK9_BLUHO|nr:unnamed protein product [Blumeria hordei]SZF02601.1 unnamed protein product [Blumeria hordei]SZF02602.1 unnamed protein product [Blumeria hordei]SZF02603.1 unnamed protein product [Blumeria hordei]
MDLEFAVEILRKKMTRPAAYHADLIFRRMRPSYVGNFLADFLQRNLMTRDDIHVATRNGGMIKLEARFGTFINEVTNKPIDFPFKAACVLLDDARLKFERKVVVNQNQASNLILSNTATKTQSRDQAPGSRGRMHELQCQKTESSFVLPREAEESLPASTREILAAQRPAEVLITRDDETGKIEKKVIKTSLTSLNVHSGFLNVPDYQISVYIEFPYHGDVDELLASQETRRMKVGRLVHHFPESQTCFRVGLTEDEQGSIFESPPGSKESCEVETVLSIDALINEGRRAIMGQQNEYIQTVEGLLKSIQVVATSIG